MKKWRRGVQNCGNSYIFELTMCTVCSRIKEKKEGIYMATTTPTQIRIEENTKKQAVELLEGLGLNLSDAVNMFLRQVILQNGIPFEVKYPDDTMEFRPEVIEAMEEAKKISRDPNVKGYTDVKQMFREILEDGAES